MSRTSRPSHRRELLVLIVVGALVWACGSSRPSSRSTQSPGPVQSIASPGASITPPTSSGQPIGQGVTDGVDNQDADSLLNAVVVTVSDRLRVRSQPRVSDDSIKYEPVLPLGTELLVTDGPVSASGYTWYKVEPVSFAGLDGPGYGWVAMAGKDGEPWIERVEYIDGAGLEDGDAVAMSASINAFGLELFRAMLADPDLNLDAKSVVFSPTSIALALGMARAGAHGETAAEMDRVLRAGGWEELASGLNALDRALDSRNATWQDPGLDPPARELTLRTVNTSFAQRGWTIEQSYLDTIASAFGADLRLVDFETDREAARSTINAWVSDQTRKRIPHLLAPEDLLATTRLALVNAIYLKAGWLLEFERAETKSALFTRLDGSEVDVAMMHRLGGQEIPYAGGNGWQASELRYRGPGSAPLAMTLIVPDDLAAFEASVTEGQLGRITTALETQRERLQDVTSLGIEDCGDGTYPYSVSLFMPRFGVETRAGLVGVLKALGMPLAFDKAFADFTGIHVPLTPQERIYISAVVHQANIDVDERGTEAAAATAVVMSDTTGGCGPPTLTPRREIILRLDRPFLFVLRDVETGAVLFMGRVTDPSTR